MDASHWALLVVGLMAGGMLGFFIGRLSGGITAGDLAAAKIQEIDARADNQRDAIDAEVNDARKQAPTMNGVELESALNEAFEKPAAAPLPTDHPLRRPVGK